MLLIRCLAIAVLYLAPAMACARDSMPKPVSHSSRALAGWRVNIDDRLLNEQQELGARALRLLTARLVAIEFVVPEPALTRLREVPIQIDFAHGELRNMQYHPSAHWLKQHGYAESLEKCVHIPAAEYFLSPYEIHRQPWVLLHELAHAYHDRVLGFDEPRIRAGWERFKESGHFREVLTITGKKREHYALTDAKEFFAEMTECYFGTNDFYPFVAGELLQAHPETYELMRTIWGALPAQK